MSAIKILKTPPIILPKKIGEFESHTSLESIGGYELGKVHCVNCLEAMKKLPDGCIQCCVTSPPYWGLRDYGVDGQLGLEKTPEEYVAKMVAVFAEVRRVLRNDGTLWLNLGDSYARDPRKGEKFRGKSKEYLSHNHDGLCGPEVPANLKPKDLVGIPWRVALALQADGWCLRSDIIWSKPNPMPESVTDRPTKSHEYIFLLTKAERYYYDAEAIAESATSSGPRRDTGESAFNCDVGMYHGRAGNRDDGTRNRRSVWTISTKPYKEAHFATFPPELPEICIRAGTKPGDVVCDPFCGSGTTGEVAMKFGRQFIGFELNPQYARELATPRIEAAAKGIRVTIKQIRKFPKGSEPWRRRR